MSIYYLPPTCGAYASSAYDAGCRISPGRCHQPATRRVIAYALTSPELFATHTEETCDAHAEDLAEHWHRHGVRRPGKRQLWRVVAQVTEYQRSHVGTYPTQLLAPLPEMPHAYELRRDRPGRPAFTSSPVVFYDDDHGRIDIEPSDRSGFGRERRTMIVSLAGAYGCQASAGFAVGGVLRHRLNLQVFGARPNITAFASALAWTMNAAESECTNAARGYTSWLRQRPDGDHDPAWRPSLRRAWKRHFLTSWVNRWCARMYAAERGEAGPMLAGAPRADADAYPAHQAADRSADERWRDLRMCHQDRVRYATAAAVLQAEDDKTLGREPTTPAVPMPPDPGGTLTAPGVTQPPRSTGPAAYGHRARHLRPLLPDRLDQQLSLWPVPATVLPVPAIPPRHEPPRGRPLLEVLSGMVQ
ncbi:hypothetical protein [Streptomyces sp. NPDC002276]